MGVQGEDGGVNTNPESNGSAVVMGRKQLAALSDDPDELAQELQAMAGPAPGPNGSQVFIDGFTGGNLPPKSEIRKILINANPWSAEYDSPGFGRIEIITKPGSNDLHGDLFGQYNDEYLNSRDPLLPQSTRPPYQVQFYGLDLTGPLKANKASFTLDAEHRDISDNALILATTLDSNLNPVPISEAVATPQTRTTISSRLDYAINANNSLMLRYQHVGIGMTNEGVGGFNLPSRAYDETSTENTIQATETAILNPKIVNETRFQFMRTTVQNTGNDTTPGIDVIGAFYGGGPTIGNSRSVTDEWEITNSTTFQNGPHTWKWGGRLRGSLLTDTSFNNFAGTYTFFTLAQYEAALANLPGAEPAQFSLNAGTPTTKVNQVDVGLFVNDDWKVKSNLTFSYGLRYEDQTNIDDPNDWAPRLGIAWGLDAKSYRPARTVLRAGLGAFYTRVPETVTLDAVRYNGITQQSYLIENPSFYPTIPSSGTLQGETQAFQPASSSLVAGHTYQGSVGLERQLGSHAQLAVTYIYSRGVHLQNAGNLNTPINGVYPFGNKSIYVTTQSSGLMRQNQLILSPNLNYNRLSLWGYYALSYGMDNNEGLPENPYDLSAEWGPSTYGDVRNRAVLGSSVTLPKGFTVSPVLVASSGQPYNITTGLDPYNTGFPEGRPALLPGVRPASCQGSDLVYKSGFGCFNLNPAPGTPTIERDSGRGPATVNLVGRMSWTFGFGGGNSSGSATLLQGPGQMSGDGSHTGGDTVSRSTQGGVPPSGFFAPNTERKYSITFSVSTLNALNTANYAPPNGDLSSPYFGQYTSLGGPLVIMHGGAASSYNRKVDFQMRFNF